MAIGGAAGRAYIAAAGLAGEIPSRVLSAFGASGDSREGFLLGWLRGEAS